jgi:hypothetical protein
MLLGPHPTGAAFNYAVKKETTIIASVMVLNKCKNRGTNRV